jgi:DNA-binding beta-propeller fold protein YncE
MAFERKLMEDPVVASDGHTYDRKDIQNWFKTHDASPHTNEPFEDKVLRPNIAIRKLVVTWREKHGLPVPSFGAPAKAQAVGGGAAAAAQIPKPAKKKKKAKPAALCGFSKQPLQVFCITCDKAICVSCAIDPARCQSHDMRQLASIVSRVRDVHAAWLQLRDGRPQQLQAEFQRVDAAAEAAIQTIREEAAELKVELQRACLGDLERTLQEQAQLLADVEIAAASPEAAVAGSQACCCLRTAATRGSQVPGEGAGGGRFEAVVGGGGGGDGGGGCGEVRRLGRIVLRDVAVRRWAGGVGGVAALGAGFLRAFGSSGAGNGQFNCPFGVAMDHEGNVVVSDFQNHRIQVLRYSDGQHLRTIGKQGAGHCQFNSPYGVALDGAGHLVVVDSINHRVQVLNYADGSHVRTIGSKGSGQGQFAHPSGVSIDVDGNIVVHDGHTNGRIQIFRLSDGAHIRSICSKGNGLGQLSGHGSVAFDAEGNLVVVDGGNHRIQVLRYSDGQHMRTIGKQGAGNCQFSDPRGLALDGAGHLVVVDRHRVQVLNYADGSHVRTIGSKGSGQGQFCGPCGGVCIDDDGRIIVCDTNNHRIQVLE